MIKILEIGLKDSLLLDERILHGKNIGGDPMF